MTSTLTMWIFFVVVGFPGTLVGAYFLARGKRSGPFLVRHRRAVSIGLMVITLGGVRGRRLLWIESSVFEPLWILVVGIGVWLMFFLISATPEAPET